jgi:hypothetical protein
MKTKDKDKNWHLIRNDNGEWVSEEKVVFLSRFDAGILHVLAAKNGKPFSIQHGPDNSLWCYKHEYEDINTQYDQKSQASPRILRIKKK